MKLPLKIASLASLVLLAACGKYGELEPQPGTKPAPVAYGQQKAASADDLLEPTAQARPGRSVELLLRSDRREDDAFDLPPGSAPEVDASNAASEDPAAPDDPK